MFTALLYLNTWAGADAWEAEDCEDGKISVRASDSCGDVLVRSGRRAVEDGPDLPLHSGATRLFHNRQIWEPLERSKVDGRVVVGERGERNVVDAVVPRAGRVLLFYHRLMHEGLPAGGGVEIDGKYIVRTDLVFRRRPGTELLTKDQIDPVSGRSGREAYRLYCRAQELAEKSESDEVAADPGAKRSLSRRAMEMFREAFGMSAELRRIYRQ